MSALTEFVSVMIDIDYKAIGLSDFGSEGSLISKCSSLLSRRFTCLSWCCVVGNYYARQIARWTQQYLNSKTKDIASMNNLIQWLPKNIPLESEGPLGLSTSKLINDECASLINKFFYDNQKQRWSMETFD